ncbi:MAG: preprotein translocase subunit SecE [Patescibacteria group bacterium]|nr:preprotein translocase subunit SecE [Patescibacteria group bacterium]
MANKLINYFKEAKEELKKVSWPTRKETIHQTLIVLGVCLVVGAFLGLVDYLLNIGVQQIISIT